MRRTLYSQATECDRRRRRSSLSSSGEDGVGGGAGSSGGMTEAASVVVPQWKLEILEKRQADQKELDKLPSWKRELIERRRRLLQESAQSGDRVSGQRSVRQHDCDSAASSNSSLISSDDELPTFRHFRRSVPTPWLNGLASKSTDNNMRANDKLKQRHSFPTADILSDHHLQNGYHELQNSSGSDSEQQYKPGFVKVLSRKFTRYNSVSALTEDLSITNNNNNNNAKTKRCNSADDLLDNSNYRGTRMASKPDLIIDVERAGDPSFLSTDPVLVRENLVIIESPEEKKQLAIEGEKVHRGKIEPEDVVTGSGFADTEMPKVDTVINTLRMFEPNAEVRKRKPPQRSKYVYSPGSKGKPSVRHRVSLNRKGSLSKASGMRSAPSKAVAVGVKSYAASAPKITAVRPTLRITTPIKALAPKPPVIKKLAPQPGTVPVAPPRNNKRKEDADIVKKVAPMPPAPSVTVPQHKEPKLDILNNVTKIPSVAAPISIDAQQKASIPKGESSAKPNDVVDLKPEKARVILSKSQLTETRIAIGKPQPTLEQTKKVIREDKSDTIEESAIIKKDKPVIKSSVKPTKALSDSTNAPLNETPAFLSNLSNNRFINKPPAVARDLLSDLDLETRRAYSKPTPDGMRRVDASLIKKIRSKGKSYRYDTGEPLTTNKGMIKSEGNSLAERYRQQYGNVLKDATIIKDDDIPVTNLDEVIFASNRVVDYPSVTFIGENAPHPSGKSCLLSQTGKKLAIMFDESSTCTYEYASEASVLAEFQEVEREEAGQLQSNLCNGDAPPLPPHEDGSRKEEKENEDPESTTTAANNPSSALKSTPAIGSAGGLGSYTSSKMHAMAGVGGYQLGMEPPPPPPSPPPIDKLADNTAAPPDDNDEQN